MTGIYEHYDEILKENQELRDQLEEYNQSTIHIRYYNRSIEICELLKGSISEQNYHILVDHAQSVTSLPEYMDFMRTVTTRFFEENPR